MAATAFLSLASSPAAARAQWLELGSPEAPAPGAGRAALALAEQLASEINNREAALAPAASTNEDRLADELQAATRRLIRALLLKAEELGEPGSWHALVAWTLWIRIDEMDALAAELREGGSEAGLAVAHAAGHFVHSVERLCAAVPDSAADLDRSLRDALAFLVQHTAAPSVAEPVDLSAAAAGWADLGVSPELIAAVNAWRAEVLQPATAWIAYRPAAESIADAIVHASRILHSVSGPGGTPQWITEPARSQLLRRFEVAATGALDPSSRAEALEQLQLLSRAADLLAALEHGALQGPPNTRPSHRTLVAARAALLSTIEACQTSPAARGLLTLWEAALRVLAERSTLEAEDTIVREARPAWRVLESELRRSETALWDILGRIGPRSTDQQTAAIANDPMVISALAAQRRAVEDLRALGTISAWIASEPEMLTQPQRVLAARRVLQLGQDLGVAPRRGPSLAALRQLGMDLSDLLSMPGEAELRAGGAAWDILTGGRRNDLVRAIDTHRRAWLTEWAQDREPAGTRGAVDVDRLRSFQRLLAALHDAATFRQTMHASALNASPAWELSPQAAAAFWNGAEPLLARATAEALDADSTAAAVATLRQFNDTRVVIRLAAALERTARQRGLQPVPVVLELAGAAPRPAWLGASRADLAAVCRYAQEYAHATNPTHESRRDLQRAEQLLRYINLRAESALRRLPVQ